MLTDIIMFSLISMKTNSLLEGHSHVQLCEFQIM